jgi:hypothetical protein
MDIKIISALFEAKLLKYTNKKDYDVLENQWHSRIQVLLSRLD